MLLDAQNLFSDAQAVTATAASENVIDFLASGRDMGSGEPIWLYCVCTETTVSGGSSTITVTVEVDTDSGFGSAQVIHTTAALAKATVVKGYELFKLILPPIAANYRYMRVNYTIGTADLTAGKFTAGLTLGVDTVRDYPKGYVNAGG